MGRDSRKKAVSVLGDVNAIMLSLGYVWVEGRSKESPLSFKTHFKPLLRHVYSTTALERSLNVMSGLCSEDTR